MIRTLLFIAFINNICILASAGYRIRARFHSQRPCSHHSQRTLQSRCVTECGNRPDAPGSPDSPLSRSESTKSDENKWAVTLQAAQQRIGALLVAVLLVGNMVLVPPQPALARSRLTAEETSTVDLFKESTPSVVYITNLASRCGCCPPLRPVKLLCILDNQQILPQMLARCGPY